jgi:hypothetical protein
MNITTEKKERKKKKVNLSNIKVKPDNEWTMLTLAPYNPNKADNRRSKCSILAAFLAQRKR